MQRTQISLTPRQHRLLVLESQRTGRSMAELIRAAVDAIYFKRSDADVQDTLDAIEAAFGSWSDRDVDGREYVERLRSGRRRTT